MKLLPILLLICAVSCKPTEKTITSYRYFDKNLDSLKNVIVTLKEPVIQKHDQLSIVVSSATLNQEQTTVFNLMNDAGTSGIGGVSGYLVDYDGTINMPIVGKIKAEGLTKNQLADTLIQKLQPWVKNPVINIRFNTFRVMLIGEGSRGWVNFTNEKATIVDAVGQAGGLTETALRSDILLIRQNPDGQLETHRLDMNDALIFQSPYFQLQQNDVLYIQPNDSKLLQYQRSNSPFFRDLPLYMGLITSILAFITLIISLGN